MLSSLKSHHHQLLPPSAFSSCMMLSRAAVAGPLRTWGGGHFYRCWCSHRLNLPHLPVITGDTAYTNPPPPYPLRKLIFGQSVCSCQWSSDFNNVISRRSLFLVSRNWQGFQNFSSISQFSILRYSNFNTGINIGRYLQNDTFKKIPPKWYVKKDTFTKIPSKRYLKKIPSKRYLQKKKYLHQKDTLK